MTPWTVARQAPLSMGFSRQEYCSGLPFPSPRDLPDPGVEPRSPTLQADVLTSEPPEKPSQSLVLAKASVDLLPLAFFFIETCILSCKIRSASLCSIQDTGCLGLVHGDDPER